MLSQWAMLAANLGLFELDYYEDEGAEPVEHVMNCHAGKCSPHLVPVWHLCKRYDSVCDGGPNVGSHNHWDGGLV